jgi:hypothetical protein
MGRRFVDAIWINQRLDRRDRRFQREQAIRNSQLRLAGSPVPAARERRESLANGQPTHLRPVATEPRLGNDVQDMTARESVPCQPVEPSTDETRTHGTDE